MSARAERRHPEKVAVDPAVCEPARKRTREEMRALGVIGGYARAANLSEEEMREQMRRVRAARTAKDDARRAEQGLPPRVPTPKPLSDEEEAFWLSVVEERFPDRVFTNRMQKPRLALRLAREAAARAAEAAFRNRGVE
ncbi:hypothetical protein [uncultured Microbacterium sp.]|uniref:hypothetical protein n=1 Tax=uncultured Microbacterium sp. TaxID=191216 RepID=UPI0028E5ED13|nr:hypothetical protein [uncultured Microbacterium sp.]